MSIIKKAFLRGILPLLIMTGIAAVMHHQGMDFFQVKSTFITGLIMTAVASASVIYEISHWSLKKQSLLHFLLMLITVLPCLLLSGWFPLSSAGDYAKVFGIFLLTGLMLWSIAYFIFKKLSAK